jgi:MtaA/CmuA family methyltransferase
MNGFQRIQSALNGEKPDKTPIMLHNFMLAAREAGITMKQYREDPEKMAHAHIRFVEKYEVDGVMLDIDTALLADAIGVPVAFPEDEPARANSALIQSYDQLKDLEPVDIRKNERIMISLEAAGIMVKYFNGEIFVRGNCDQAPFSVASMVRTPAEWMMDLLIDEEFCFNLLDYCLSPCLQYLELMSETGVHMLSNGDSPAGPDMLPPDMFVKYAKPYEIRMVRKAHELNLPYCNHICGNTNIILKEMMSTGVDALELDYKTDIQKIYDTFHDKIALFGNIDPSGVIARGTPAGIREKVNELLTVYNDSSRFVLNAGCAIPAETPEENIRMMVKTAREWPG